MSVALMRCAYFWPFGPDLSKNASTGIRHRHFSDHAPDHIERPATILSARALLIQEFSLRTKPQRMIFASRLPSLLSLKTRPGSVFRIARVLGRPAIRSRKFLLRNRVVTRTDFRSDIVGVAHDLNVEKKSYPVNGPSDRPPIGKP